MTDTDPTSPWERLDDAARARLRVATHPTEVAPQLATPAPAPFRREGWIFERKLDGMRLLAHRDGEQVRLRSRRGEDRTGGFPELAEALRRQVGSRDAVLDGEVVAFDGARTSFARLQGRIGLNDPRRALGTGIEVHLYLFDLLHLDGHDLRALALRDRKRLLEELVAYGDPLRFTAHRDTEGTAMLADACARGWEGLIAKDAGAPYVPGRSPRWLKLKCSHGQELVVGGWSEPRGSRRGFGSLLLGYHEHGHLRYAGRVGTGFDQATLATVAARLEELEVGTSPFVDPPRVRGLHWVRPQLVAQVAFSEWTREGRLRHPRFEGLRDDRDPADVHRETPADAEPTGQDAAEARTGRPAPRRPGRQPTARREQVEDDVGDQQVQIDGRQFSVSSLDKVMFPDDGITKAQLIDHYVRLGEAILREISGRALSLKRYPDGIEGESFFQKRPSSHFPDWITRARLPEGDGQRQEYVVADQRATLAYLANQGTIELHTMMTPADAPDRPAEIVLDLDPPAGSGPEVARRATRRCLDLMEELELAVRLKSTGSSGFHVHVALDGSVDQATARAFSRDAAELLAARHPEELTVAVRKKRRADRVFVDWLRNSPGQTAIAPYSVRALPDAPVATPMDLDELAGTDPRRWTLRSLPRRLAQRADPWEQPAETTDLRAAARILAAARRAAPSV